MSKIKSFLLFVVRFGFFLILVAVLEDPFLTTLVVSLVYYIKLGRRKELLVYWSFMLFVLIVS